MFMVRVCFHRTHLLYACIMEVMWVTMVLRVPGWPSSSKQSPYVFSHSWHLTHLTFFVNKALYVTCRLPFRFHHKYFMVDDFPSLWAPPAVTLCFLQAINSIDLYFGSTFCRSEGGKRMICVTCPQWMRILTHLFSQWGSKVVFTNVGAHPGAALVCTEIHCIIFQLVQFVFT